MFRAGNQTLISPNAQVPPGGSRFPLMLEWWPLDVVHAHSAAGRILSRALLLSCPRDWPLWEHESSLGHSSGELGLGWQLLIPNPSSLSRESPCWLVLKRTPTFWLSWLAVGTRQPLEVGMGSCWLLGRLGPRWFPVAASSLRVLLNPRGPELPTQVVYWIPQGCHTKLPETGKPKTTETNSSHFWRPEVQNPGVMAGP